MDIDRIYSFIKKYDINGINGHGLVIGQTGYGKSTFLKMVIKKRIGENKRIIVLDPHGDISKSLMNTGIYISPSHMNINGKEYCFKMNLMNTMNSTDPDRVQTVIDTLKMVFSMDEDFSNGTWGPRLDNIFTVFGKEIYNENPDPTLEDLFSRVMDKITENSFFRNMSKYQYSEYIQSFINKLNPIINNTKLKNFISSRGNMEFLFSGKNLYFDFEKLHYGENSARMMASSTLAILFNFMKFGIIKDSIIVIDEIKDFSPYILPNLLSESRKYGVEILMATQYLSQMDRDLVNSVMANSEYIAIFRISPFDAKILSGKIPMNRDKFILMTTNMEKFQFLLYDGNISHGKTENVNFDDYKTDNDTTRYLDNCDAYDDEIKMLSVIISLTDRNGHTFEKDAVREFESLSDEDPLRVLRILNLKNMIRNENGKIFLETNGIRISESYLRNFTESIYHAYLIRRTASFMISLGYEIKTARPFENSPDITAVKGKDRISVEAEYGDLKNPGKLLMHVINKERVIFSVFRNDALSLFCTLIQPVKILNGQYHYYRYNGEEIKIEKLDDYMDRVWILSVPYPSEKGIPEIYNPLNNYVDYNFDRSNIFKIKGRNIDELFKGNIFIDFNGKKLTRCEYLKFFYNFY
ncbi:MAG: ATP-binding protein [Thermoplasmata archaeon]